MEGGRLKAEGGEEQVEGRRWKAEGGEEQVEGGRLKAEVTAVEQVEG